MYKWRKAEEKILPTTLEMLHHCSTNWVSSATGSESIPHELRPPPDFQSHQLTTVPMSKRCAYPCSPIDLVTNEMCLDILGPNLSFMWLYTCLYCKSTAVCFFNLLTLCCKVKSDPRETLVPYINWFHHFLVR